MGHSVCSLEALPHSPLGTLCFLVSALMPGTLVRRSIVFMNRLELWVTSLKLT